MSEKPEAIVCVIPSRLAVGEPCAAKIKVLGQPRAVPWSCFAWARGGRPMHLHAVDKECHPKGLTAGWKHA